MANEQFAQVWADSPVSELTVDSSLVSDTATQTFADWMGSVKPAIDAVQDAAVGFYGATPVAQQTGVAVDAAGIHAALVNLGLITA